MTSIKPDLEPDPDPHWLAPWIRILIRIHIKNQIRICIETNADPQHCVCVRKVFTERIVSNW